jgi:LemA protein
MIPLLTLLAVFFGLIAFVTLRFNRLVALRNQFKNAFAQIDVQLKRRHDLIPNLVETAKGYLKHEKETLEAVIAARNSAVSAASAAAANPTQGSSLIALAGAESALTGALGKLFALAEAYPDLKANQTMIRLMEELTTTENKVSFARQSYNDAVMVYNTAREQVPDVLFAGALGFSPAQLFEVTNEQEREVQKVSF